ncbi:MAG: hypothetical protein CMC70_05220 [Flavobacteriaceae bacterium]|nr:hypothetical protein [Flavobacteriaceae bacterium]
MKKFKHLSLILIALFAVVFTSCEDEPLEGEFVTEEPGGGSPGSFVATVDGQSFSATQVIAEINQGALFINGNDGNFSIAFVVTNKSECVFDLTTFSTTANIGQITGEAYSTNPLSDLSSGTLEITSYNTEDLTVSGTFEFVAVELTPNGPGTETIAVTEGSFTSIPFIVNSGEVEPSECVPPGTGGDPDPDPDPEPEPAILFAKADTVDFIPAQVEVSQYMVGMQPMIQVKATDAIGATLRLDIPETLALGTFDLFTGISDGTKRIGYYDPNTGGETLSSNPGTITITEFSSFTGKLVATFEFTAQDPLGEDPTVVQITEGNLDIHFEPTPGNITLAFEADIDGNGFTAESVTVTNNTFNEISIITIAATMGGETIQLDFPMAAVSEGTYGMSPALFTGNEIVGTYLPTTGSAVAFTSDPGTFTITTFDEAANVIEGTFSFTARDATATDPAVYQITNGTFLIQL